MGKIAESTVCDICRKEIWGNQRWDFEVDLIVREVYMLHFKRKTVNTYDICGPCKTEMITEIMVRLKQGQSDE